MSRANPHTNDLRHRVIIQKNGGSQDSQSGAIVESWTNVARVFAGVWPLRGSERLEAHQITPGLSHEIVIRYRDDVYPSIRILIPRNYTTLGAAITTTGQTSVTAGDADLVPDARIENVFIQAEEWVSGAHQPELMQVTAGFGTTSLTVTRGGGGDTAATFTTSATLTHMQILEVSDVVNLDNMNEFLSITGAVRV